MPTLNILQDFTRRNSPDDETRQIVDDLISHNEQRKVPETVTGGGIITREFTAWCGLCEEWEQQTALSMKAVHPKFIGGGWSKTKKHGWLCPKCSEKSTPTEK